jgi:hypothetical protein
MTQRDVMRLNNALNAPATGKYQVKLWNAGNPDYRQDHTKPLPDTAVGWAQVDSFKEASELCRLYIEFYDLGGGNWTGGEITDQSGLVVARVSYNGRVWEAGKYAEKEILV